MLEATDIALDNVFSFVKTLDAALLRLLQGIEFVSGKRIKQQETAGVRPIPQYGNSSIQAEILP